MELGRYGEARDAYGAALRVDSMNGIAQKNFARLSKLVEEQDAAAEPVPTPVDPSLFIEETGKTALTTLTSITEPDALARITAGDPLTLEVHGNVVRVIGPAGEPLGRLEPKIGQRVIGLMNEGNQYTAAVTAVDDQSVRVIIREAHRDPSMGDRPSFPTTGASEGFRAYTRETVIRYDVEDEDEDGMDDSDSEHETTSEADSDGEAGAEESEFSEES
jgi:hypothetical protein